MSVSHGTPNSIPFLDLVTPHLELERELTEVFRKALRTAGFIGGPMVEDFEKAFATFCDVGHSVAVSSGTDALRFALMANGVKPGDVVVTVPHTFIATTEAISQAGALPEFVDIDERTYNMDPAKLGEYLEQQCTVDASGKLISRRSGRRVARQSRPGILRRNYSSPRWLRRLSTRKISRTRHQQCSRIFRANHRA